MRMIQKVALNSFKIGYVQAETPKFPRPCTLACNCKIIWDSEFDEVGELSRKFQSYPLGEGSRKTILNFNLKGISLELENFVGLGLTKPNSKSTSWAGHMSTWSSKWSKPSKRSQAVRVSKETQIKAKRASMGAIVVRL